jgi:DNA-binding response OmpR family regulator
MRSLTQAQGRTVSKSELTDAIFGQRIGNATERLNVLVTRLRKKVHHQLGESLPIETVRQVGYTFTAPAELF